jgi:dGTPase
LAHDLGHPPFGHAGEAALQRLMAGAGGFEHNLHAHRVVTYLEHPYPPFRGLNLTFEVREGIVKHHTRYDRPDVIQGAGLELAVLYEAGPQASAEAQIACLADEIAYVGHDLEDAVGAELVHESDLEGLALWHSSADAIRRDHPDRPLVAILRPILDHLQHRMIEDAAGETARAVTAAGVRDADGVRSHAGPLVRFSPSMAESVGALQRFLHENMYRHHRLVRMDHKAGHLIEAVFGAYRAIPRLMPPRFARRVDEQGVERVVCDYVAGMTDRFCQKEYSKLFEPFDWE